LLVLADELGKDDVAASQLEKILIDEAEDSGTIARCAKSLLVRELHEELPEGWRTEWDEATWFQVSKAYGAWAAALGERYEQSYRRVWDVFIDTMPIPAGWLPAGPDDPILVEAFKHWNAPNHDAT